MKTRIKVVTTAAGSTYYYPQYKRLFFWVDFKFPLLMDSPSYRYDTLEDAKAHIDIELVKKAKREEAKRHRKADSKIVSTDFVKHP